MNAFKKWALVLLILPFLLGGCVPREVTPIYQGLTAQKLMSKSIDKAVKKIDSPELFNFALKKVYVDWNALSTIKESKFIKARFITELEHFGIQIVTNPKSANATIIVFCTEGGTDHDFTGLETPNITLYGFPMPQIQILGISQFEGQVKLYYFIKNANGVTLSESPNFIGNAKSNRLNLFSLGIPIPY